MDAPQKKKVLCDICGDVGVDDAILTCTLCKINCEHMYCMRVPLQEPLDDWICGDCELSIYKPEQQESSLPREVSKMNSVEVGKSGAENRKLQNESRVGQGHGNWEKRVEKGKTKYLSVNEVIKLSSGDKNSSAPVRFNWRSKPKRANIGTNVFDRTAVRSKTGPVNISSQRDLASQQTKLNRPGNVEISKKPLQHSVKLTVPRQVSSPEPSQIPKHRHIPKEQRRETQLAQTKATRLVKKKPSILSFNASPVTISNKTGGNICTAKDLRNKDQDHDQAKGVHDTSADAENKSLIVSPDLEKRLRPSLDALWKGMFRIHDEHRKEELNPQIQAYPPSIVRRKIYEFSKKMPQELHFQLVSAKTFWTDLFDEYTPDVRDIALYFFPKFSGRSEDYIFLLESISLRDLALREQIDDVELLVFTSKLLHVDYQQLNGKYFLWGVFHRLKKDTALCSGERVVELSDEARDPEEVDMEIDMIGGADVGRVDIPVESSSSRPP